MIRRIEHGDLQAVANLAHSERLLSAGRGPRLWSPAGLGQHAHPLLLGRRIDTSGTLGLVDDRGGALVGAAIAVPPPGSEPAWVVHEFVVRSPAEWATTGRTLLAALASRAVSAGIDELVVPCATVDLAKAHMLESAGFHRRWWVRHRAPGPRRTAPPPGVRGYVEADASSSWQWRGPQGIPLTHSSTRVPGGTSALVFDEATPAAAVSIAGDFDPPAGYTKDGTGLLAGPFALKPGTDLEAVVPSLLAGLQWLATSRGDSHVLVASWSEDPELDSVLAGAGYDDPLSWWRLVVERPAR